MVNDHLYFAQALTLQRWNYMQAPSNAASDLSPQMQSNQDLLKSSGINGFYFVVAAFLFIFTEPRVVAELTTALVFFTLILLAAIVRFYYSLTLRITLPPEIPRLYIFSLYINALLWGVFSAWLISFDTDFGSMTTTICVAAGAIAAISIMTLQMRKWLGSVIAALIYTPLLAYLTLFRPPENLLLLLALLSLYIYFLFKLSNQLFQSYWNSLNTLAELKHKSQELEAARNKAMQVNEALEAATNEAINANLAKTEFLAHMSHEIRTPLNGVVGMADVLATSRLDNSQLQYVNTILESGKLVMSIVNDILDFSQINSGKIAIAMKPVSVSKLATDSINMLQLLASRNHNSLILQDNLPPNCLITTDELRLQQLLTNLISNALKFTDHGVVSIELELEEKNALYTLSIAVRDTGIGIPPEALTTIFEAFHQLGRPGDANNAGTGLGLAICKKLVLLLNGEIRVESIPSEGSCFYIHLPVPPPEYGSTDSSAFLQSHAQNIAHDCDLLVVEDNRVNQLVLEAFLEKLGYRFTLVSTGEAALEAYEQHQPDLILMDLNLPDVDGRKVAGKIREKEAAHPGKRCVIIALTADAHATAALECSQAGMDDHLPKPISLAKLAGTLNHWLS